MRYTSAIAAIAAFVLAPVTPASATGMDEIPFDITESGHLVVSVELNDDKTVNAIIDTGATFPILDSKSASAVGISLSEDPSTIEIIGLGEMQTFPVVELDRLSVGPLDMRAVRTAYNDSVPFPSSGNVLPSKALPYRTLDFDFKTSRLRLYDHAPMGVPRSRISRIDIQDIGGLPFIQVSVNGVEGLALIDTGASVTVVNSAFAEGAARSPKSIRTIELASSTGPVTPIKILFSRRFELGKFEVDHFNVVVSNPEFLERFGLSEKPVMILGLDILKTFRLQIDRDAKELRLSLPDPSFSRGPGMSIRRQ